MHWMDRIVAMKIRNDDGSFGRNWNSFDDDYFHATLDLFAADIMESKYDSASPEEVAAAQKHLTAAQREDARKLVLKHQKLFSGKLGRYPHKLIHLEVEDGARPVHSRPYSVAHSHIELFKQELKRLCEIGVLRPCGATQWACPTFIVPKKDGRVRWVSDFRELNKVLIRRVKKASANSGNFDSTWPLRIFYEN